MKKQGGFIKYIILIVIALIILGYYGFDIRKAIEAPTTQHNLTYVQQVVANIWNHYLKGPVTFLWNEIFIKYAWNPLMDHLKK